MRTIFIFLAITLFPFYRTLAQCAAGVAPSYPSGCVSQYFTSITASGTSVASTISYTGGSCIGTYFNNFLTQGVTAPTGATVNINISRLASYYAYLAVYVDWNNDNVFETTELASSVMTMPVGLGSTTYSFTIPLLGIVTNTNLHMRVFLGEPPTSGGALSTISPPCSAKWGESCEYYINATCTTPTITVSPADPGVCVPTGSAALTASGAGASPIYTWAPPTGLSASTGATVTATPVVTSTYTVTGYGPGVCPASAPVTVSVNPLVSPVITPSGPTTICAGSSITLSETSGTGSIYQWYSGTTAITGATSNSYIATPAGTTIYSVAVSSTAGCTGGGVITITVAALPVPVITPSGPTSFCSGSSVTLTETSGTGTSWQWYSGTTAITGATTNSYTASPAVTSTYSVVVTSGAGCTASAAITISVLTSPTPVITASGPLVFCSGGSVTLTESSGTGITYQWYRGATSIAGATTNSYIASPAVTTTYSVSLTNAAGCTAYTSVTVTVNPTPTPVITPGGPTSFCIGGSVTLTESSGTGTFYQWYKGATVIAGATTNSYTASPSVTTTYSVTVSTGAGCTGAASITVTVFADPAPIIYAGGPLAFCSGGSVTLSEVSGTGTLYQWYNGAAPVAGATTSTYIATPPTTTTYSVSVTSGGGCTGSASVVVTVFPTPAATITPAGPTTVCSPGAVLLNANVLPGYTYIWFDDGAIISGATSQFYTAATSGIYSVGITSTNGCKDTSVQIVVTIEPSPVASATASGPLTFCSYSSVTLTAAETPGYTYQWLDGTTPISGATNVSFTATVVGTHDYRVIVTNAAGCSDTTATGLFTVVVNPAPVTTVTASGSLSFCSGGSVTLSVPFVAGYTYQWFTGGTAMSGATSAAYTATTTGNYYVIIYTPAGCTGMSLPSIVTNVVVPSISYSTPLHFCWGSSVTLSLGISTSATGITFQWTRNGANIPGANAATYSAFDSGTYTCTVNVGGGGCIATTAPVTVSIYPLPDPVISYSGGYLKTWTYYTSYQWYRNFTLIVGATQFHYPPSVPADYNVIVTDTNGCVSEAASYPLTHIDTIINAAAVIPLPGTDPPAIYPNPATNNLFVRYSENVRIVITAFDGKKILEEPSARVIDITSLPLGVYIITLQDENGNRLLVRKLIKQ